MLIIQKRRIFNWIGKRILINSNIFRDAPILLLNETKSAFKNEMLLDIPMLVLLKKAEFN